MSSLESLKKKHALTGVYSVSDGSALCAELEAYAAALECAEEQLSQMYRECFAATAQSYGLSRREVLINGMASPELSDEKRRQLLLERLSVTSQDFTRKALERLLSAFGTQFSITENPSERRMVVDAELTNYPQEVAKRFVKTIEDFVPAYIETEIVYSGKRWSTVDGLDLTFAQMDALDYTWNTIDNLI